MDTLGFRNMDKLLIHVGRITPNSVNGTGINRTFLYRPAPCTPLVIDKDLCCRCARHQPSALKQLRSLIQTCLVLNDLSTMSFVFIPSLAGLERS